MRRKRKRKRKRKSGLWLPDLSTDFDSPLGRGKRARKPVGAPRR